MHRSSAYVSSPAALLPSWLIGSSRTDCVNLKSLFSCRFYLSLLCTRRNVGFICEKCDSQQASLCHFSVISVWYPEGGLNCDRNGRNELICSAEASIHLNVIQLVPVSLKWSSIFFLSHWLCVLECKCAYVCVCACTRSGLCVVSSQPWMQGRSSQLQASSGLLPWWSDLRVNNSKLTGLKSSSECAEREGEGLLLCNFSNYIYISHFIYFLETNCRALDFRDIVDNLVIRKAFSRICCVIT